MNAATAPSCAGCRFFSASAQDIESQLPGLRILSSAYAAVRSEDGLCRHHDRYIAAASICDAFESQVERLSLFES
jgi:hypothetical protein